LTLSASSFGFAASRRSHSDCVQRYLSATPGASGESFPMTAKQRDASFGLPLLDGKIVDSRMFHFDTLGC
jgi:hypothetical protein